MAPSRRTFLRSTVSPLALLFFARGGIGTGTPVITITGVTLDNNSFVGGSASGTLVGNISVQTTGGSFTGSLSLSGTDAAKFQIVGTQLQTSGVVAAGTYSINIIATQAAAIGSPFTQPETITGTSTSSHKVATMTLVNDTGSTMTAGTYFAWTCWPFVLGDIPLGAAPIFKQAGTGTVQPFSWGLQAYRPVAQDAGQSLRNATFVIRPTFDLPANSSLTIEIWTAGTAPSVSARTTTELFAQLLQTNVTGLGASFGLSGNLVGVLANDSNLFSNVAWIDGDAGKGWISLTDMATVAGGAAQGQMETEHFTFLATDSVGGLGAVFYNPHLRQSKYNNDTPAKAPRSFSSVSWQWGAGPTTVPLVWPYSAVNFTGATGATANNITYAASIDTNLYQGAADGNSMTPGYLTTTGTLPAGLNGTTLYWAKAQKGLRTGHFQTYPGMTGTGIALTDTGTGTHTFNPVPTLLHFDRMHMRTADAHWNVFQGVGGSIAAPKLCRVTIDRPYWHRSGLMPPSDLSLIGTVLDNAAFTWSWGPFTTGPVQLGRSSTGSRFDIGPLPGYAVTDFFVQTKNSELIVRLMANGAHCDLRCFRDATSRWIPNLRNASYTGFPAPSSNQQNLAWVQDGANAGSVGWTVPPTNNQEIQFDQGSNAHRPLFCHWAYLRTGEPDWYVQAMEMAQGGMYYYRPAQWRNPTSPTTKYCVTAWQAGSFSRGVAWSLRELILFAAVAATTSPWGTSEAQYFLDCVADTFQFYQDVYNDISVINSYQRNTRHQFYLWNAVGAGSSPYYSENILSDGILYLAAVVCYAAALFSDANAITWLTEFGLERAYHAATWGYYTLNYEHQRDANPSGPDGNNVTNLITSDSEVAFANLFAIGGMTWNGANSPAWQCLPNSGNKYVPANGDKMVINANLVVTKPSNYPGDTNLFFINVAPAAGGKYNFDCTTVAGNAGSIIVPAGSGTIAANAASPPYMLPIADIPPSIGAVYGGATQPGSSPAAYHNFVLNWMKAAGITNASLDAIIADQTQRYDHTGFATDPTWCSQGSF